jgi:hypothetical protein
MVDKLPEKPEWRRAVVPVAIMAGIPLVALGVLYWAWRVATRAF